jgi:hypothetical protein
MMPRIGDVAGDSARWIGGMVLRFRSGRRQVETVLGCGRAVLLISPILGSAPSPRGKRAMAVWHEALCNGRSYQKIIQLSENEDLVPAANEDLKENHRQV